MVLTTALSIATSGLRATNQEMSVVSSNIANARTEGYTKKTTNREDIVVNGQVTSVVDTAVQRTIDLLAQKQYWTETSTNNYTTTLSDYLGQVDQLFGQPGGANALDALVNEFASSLQKLQSSPDDVATRLEVLNHANVLTQRLNEVSDSIQSLRQDTELAIEEQVSNMNDVLKEIERLDQQIQEMTQNGDAPVGLMDQRDVMISQLSQFLPINVEHLENNSVSIAMLDGTMLYEQGASQFSFSANGSVSAHTEWAEPPAQSDLGSIYKVNADGTQTDVTSSRAFAGGSIGALLDLRDGLLVEAQNQLDSLADGMADAFGKFDREGTAATAGAQNGLDLDLAGLQSGDEVTFTYEDVATGESRTVTLVRVDSASSLPLDDDVTARGDDTVVGIDFSGGMASVAAQIQTALGGAFTVSNPSGDTIQILDDGAANTVNVTGFDARITATGMQQDPGALPFFIDAGAGPGIYSGSVDGARQQTGISARLIVNPALLNDPSLLVKYSSSAGSADQTRPNALNDALTNMDLQFTYQDGGAPVTMTVDEFARQIISYQGEQASTAKTRAQGQQIVMNNVLTRMEKTAKVDVDAELAKLLELQTAYSANARVMTAVREMMDALLRA